MTVGQLPLMAAVAFLSLAPIWLLYLGSPARQSARAVAFLIVISMTWLFGLSVHPSVLSYLVLAAVAGAAIAGLFTLHEFLGNMPLAEFKADVELAQVEREVLRDRRRRRLETEADRVAHLNRLQAASLRVSSLTVPEPWEELRRELANAIDADRVALRDPEAVSDAAAAAESARRWHSVDATRASVRQHRRNFWRGTPVDRRGSDVGGC